MKPGSWPSGAQAMQGIEMLVDEGMINRRDLDIFRFVDHEEEAWAIIRESLEME